MAILFPIFAVAQDDSKYLAGAIPMEDGKVVFADEIEMVPPLFSAKHIYEDMLRWASQRFSKDEAKENWGGILKEDPEKLSIDCIGQEYITFSKSSFSLDRAMIQFLLNIRCFPGGFSMRISTISYIYPEGSSNRRNAEDLITDEHALNKDKTKLIGIAKKFRIKTIDLIDELYDSAGNAMGAGPVGPTASTLRTSPAQNPTNREADKTAKAAEDTIVKTSEETVLSNTVSNTANNANIKPAAEKPVAGISENPNSARFSDSTSGPGQNLPGYTRIDVTDIPGNPFRILSRDRLTIAVGYNDPFNQTVMPAAWGGLGMIAGIPVTFCSVSQDSPYQIIEKADTYTLRFHRDGQPQPWLILECKKETSLNVNYPEGPAPVYMYIGKIIAAYIEAN